MLIRVIPLPPLPTILFTITFPNLTRDLPMPPYWDAQLQRLAAEDLEIPHSIHSLDKAAWIAALLQEVTFDMTSLTVSALFIDHSVEEWPLMGRECVSALESVLRDVNDSALESEQERADAPPPTPPAPLPPPVQAKHSKHKKQRSLLMSLVASLVPSCASFPPTPPPSQTIPALSPAPSAPSVPSLSARVLRRRARSTLVDAYRSYVLTELKTRLHSGGFSPWIVSSMLRRATEKMTWIVQQAGGIVPDLRDYSHFSSDDQLSSPAPTLMPPPLDDEDDDGDLRSLADTNSTDTDGSSVHTPTNTVAVRSHRPGYDCNVPRSPSPQAFSCEDLEMYAALSNQTLHLRRLLVHMEVVQKNLALEERQLHSVLEIKSKRRAWSNARYQGRSEVKHVGLSTPFRSSPLARFAPITRETLRMPCGGGFLSVRTMDYDVACLFPVSETDEEGEEQDLESGLYTPTSVPSSPSSAGWGDMVETQSAALEPPRIRTRTRSIHRLQALDLDPTLSPDPPILLVPPPSPASPCPSSVVHTIPAYVAAPVPVPAHHHKAMFDEFGVGIVDGDETRTTEFTLSMDVQFKPTSRTFEYERDEWLPGVVVDCR